MTLTSSLVTGYLLLGTLRHLIGIRRPSPLSLASFISTSKSALKGTERSRETAQGFTCLQVPSRISSWEAYAKLPALPQRAPRPFSGATLA